MSPTDYGKFVSHICAAAVDGFKHQALAFEQYCPEILQLRHGTFAERNGAEAGKYEKRNADNGFS
jgi:hypothetical protein